LTSGRSISWVVPSYFYAEYSNHLSLSFLARFIVCFLDSNYALLTNSVFSFHMYVLQRLSAQPNEDWDMKRVPSPNGAPEWGVPPPEPAPGKQDVP